MMMWIARRKTRLEAIDAEAIALLAEARETDPSEHNAAYGQARDLMRLSRSKDDAELERFYAKVAVRIAAVIGRRIGPKEYLESRDVPPTLRIENGRLTRIRR